MSNLAWKIDIDWPEIDQAQIAHSGKVQIGNVKRSGSGRWRWEIVSMPGMSAWKNDRSGWVDTENAAKMTVAILWSDWVKSAGLEPKQRESAADMASRLASNELSYQRHASDKGLKLDDQFFDSFEA